MNSRILKIIVIHVIGSVLWIAASDLLIIYLETVSASDVLLIGSASALLYVILTGYIFFKLIILHYNRIENSEKQYRSYYEDNPNPMWVYDRNTLRFISVNDATVSNYGYTKEEFYQMTILDIRSPEESEKVLRAVKAFDAGYKNSGIWQHKRKDGTTIYAHVTSHLIKSAKTDYVMIMANDTTERLLIEMKLQQANDELTKQNGVLREISLAESHNVRRPLASILGLLNVLRNTNDEKEKELCINYIEISASELDIMIHDVSRQINDAANLGN
ncbi:MAG: PAS domain S-box protein [Mucilaginibacter sp.]|uniref:PAS domain S-box protein n=1 Tax=Mucilaginibacter sp. TaxID=1882438 RepID=UPI003265410C